MKRRYLFIIPLVFLCFFTWAETKNNDSDFLYNFLAGSYELIGRFPDSSMTYAGKVVLIKSGDHLEVIRTIKNKVVKGTGKIETAAADKIKVLRIRFIDENKSYEGTYIIDSDLDNYARLTGFLYLKEGGTKEPGLEALFIVPR
jgi:hypothetical protein